MTIGNAVVGWEYNYSHHYENFSEDAAPQVQCRSHLENSLDIEDLPLPPIDFDYI